MIDGHPLEYDHFWKPIGETLGLYLFYFILFYRGGICVAQRVLEPHTAAATIKATTHTQKSLSRENVERDASSVSTSGVIATQPCGMMDWWSSVTDVRRLCDGKAVAAAAQDCVNIHYTPSDGEAGDSSDNNTACAAWGTFLFEKRFLPAAPTHCSLGWILNGTAHWFNPQTCLTKQGQGIILIL